MELNSYFTDFLADIRPSEQITECVEGHKKLRQQLKDDAEISSIIVATFLQGSYRRKTAIKPQGEKKLDVDVVVVTRLSEKKFTAEKALAEFVPFVEKHYPDQYEEQGRSVGIHLDKVDLDLVITSAPSEAQEGIISILERYDDEVDEDADEVLVKALVETRMGSLMGTNFSRVELLEKAIKSAKEKPQWQVAPLRIPDREVQDWRDTHPIAQMEWTIEKNASCNGHYVNVVKAIKWWRAVQQPEPKYPKSYPLEHLIGACCPDGINSVAEGVTRTLETIVSNYATNALLSTTPHLDDHGVNYNVMERVDGKDFATFYGHISSAATLARQALECEDSTESAKLWHDLFGDPFPKPTEGNGGNGDGSSDPSGGSTKGGFSPHTGSTRVERERFGNTGRTAMS